ncbi:MAG: hypothetical protein ACLU9S_20445 [Oscillospiraceae bacterium]
MAAWLTAVYTAGAKNKSSPWAAPSSWYILASDYRAPSATLIDEIQTAIDPVQNAGEGLGLPPSGTSSRVTGVDGGGR